MAGLANAESREHNPDLPSTPTWVAGTLSLEPSLLASRVRIGRKPEPGAGAGNQAQVLWDVECGHPNC